MYFFYFYRERMNPRFTVISVIDAELRYDGSRLSVIHAGLCHHASLISWNKARKRGVLMKQVGVVRGCGVSTLVQSWRTLAHARYEGVDDMEQKGGTIPQHNSK
jgi:hypothetical protein